MKRSTGWCPPQQRPASIMPTRVDDAVKRGTLSSVELMVENVAKMFACWFNLLMIINMCKDLDTKLKM